MNKDKEVRLVYEMIRSCEERSFKVEEVDSVERSRTMILTKNKPLDLALGSHGLSLNSTN